MNFLTKNDRKASQSITEKTVGVRNRHNYLASKNDFRIKPVRRNEVCKIRHQRNDYGVLFYQGFFKRDIKWAWSSVGFHRCSTCRHFHLKQQMSWIPGIGLAGATVRDFSAATSSKIREQCELKWQGNSCHSLHQQPARWTHFLSIKSVLRSNFLQKFLFLASETAVTNIICKNMFSTGIYYTHSINCDRSHLMVP